MSFGSADPPLTQEGVPLIASDEILHLSPEADPPTADNPVAAKAAIRTSLWASTMDGVFATIFSNIAGGVLLSNFLIELNASPVQVGMLASIPMMANLIQPIGAYLSNRTTSRHWYCLWIYGPARLLWILLLGAIALSQLGYIQSPQLIYLTLAIVFISHFLGALGSASWLSWLAALVPRRLRGRYFGVRNSAASLTNLLSVPLLGFIISKWWGGSLQGYGVVLSLGIVTGLISLGFQYFMVDINPQKQRQQAIQKFNAQRQATSVENPNIDPANSLPEITSLEVERPFWQDGNFLRFLLYFAVWMFSVNLSAPFFNLYLLDDLALDVSWVTIYNSLSAGANLLLLVFWGRIADRIGNRAILLLIGILVALTPILWLGTSANSLSLWLWLPLLHILGGGTWAAIDLCNGNLQMGIAPLHHQSTYFAIAAAIAGVSGALGTTAGGFLAESPQYGGVLGVFALSTVVRLVALLPLVFVRELGERSLWQTVRSLFPQSGENAT